MLRKGGESEYSRTRFYEYGLQPGFYWQGRCYPYREFGPRTLQQRLQLKLKMGEVRQEVPRAIQEFRDHKGLGKNKNNKSSEGWPIEEQGIVGDKEGCGRDSSF